MPSCLSRFRTLDVQTWAASRRVAGHRRSRLLACEAAPGDGPKLVMVAKLELCEQKPLTAPLKRHGDHE